VPSLHRMLPRLELESGKTRDWSGRDEICIKRRRRSGAEAADVCCFAEKPSRGQGRNNWLQGGRPVKRSKRIERYDGRPSSFGGVQRPRDNDPSCGSSTNGQSVSGGNRVSLKRLLPFDGCIGPIYVVKIGKHAVKCAPHIAQGPERRTILFESSQLESFSVFIASLRRQVSPFIDHCILDCKKMIVGKQAKALLLQTIFLALRIFSANSATSSVDGVRTGTCLCGAIKYQLSVPASASTYNTICHCSNCRCNWFRALHT